jgi:hypothetical protein
MRPLLFVVAGCGAALGLLASWLLPQTIRVKTSGAMANTMARISTGWTASAAKRPSRVTARLPKATIVPITVLIGILASSLIAIIIAIASSSSSTSLKEPTNRLKEPLQEVAGSAKEAAAEVAGPAEKTAPASASNEPNSTEAEPVPPPRRARLGARHEAQASFDNNEWSIENTVEIDSADLTSIARVVLQEEYNWGLAVWARLSLSPKGQELLNQADVHNEPARVRTALRQLLMDTTWGPTVRQVLNSERWGASVIEGLDDEGWAKYCSNATEASVLQDLTDAFTQHGWKKGSPDVPLTFRHSPPVNTSPLYHLFGTTDQRIPVVSIPRGVCVELDTTSRERHLDIHGPSHLLIGTDPPSQAADDKHWLVDLNALRAARNEVVAHVVHPYLRNSLGVRIAGWSLSGPVGWLLGIGVAAIVEETAGGLVMPPVRRLLRRGRTWIGKLSGAITRNTK